AAFVAAVLGSRGAWPRPSAIRASRGCRLFVGVPVAFDEAGTDEGRCAVARGARTLASGRLVAEASGGPRGRRRRAGRAWRRGAGVKILFVLAATSRIRNFRESILALADK